MYTRDFEIKILVRAPNGEEIKPLLGYWTESDSKWGGYELKWAEPTRRDANEYTFKDNLITLPYYEKALATRTIHTITRPVSALADDPDAHSSARVVVTAVSVDECAYANNEFTVYLGGGRS